MKSFFQKYLAPLSILVFLILVALDQWTKALAVQVLKNQEPYVIWDGVFEFHYFENTGAAWGMLQNQQIFFYILTVVFFVVVLYEIYRLKGNPRYTIFVYTLSVILAGAIGNFIDRLRLNYVIDFFYFSLIDFPIFNVADIYVTVAAFVMIILGMFYYKDEDYDLIFPSKKEQGKK